MQNGAAMCLNNIPTGISNWTVTLRGAWVSNDHPLSGVKMVAKTTNHNYTVAAGPDNAIKVYRDGAVILNSCTTWSPYCGWYPYCYPSRDCYYTSKGVWHVYRLTMMGGVLTAYFDDVVDYKSVVGTYNEPDIGTNLVMISPSSGSDIGVLWNYAIAAPIDPTTTSVSCSPGSVPVNQPTTCTAIVADVFANEAIPTGTVDFTRNGTCYTNGVYWTCPVPISSCTLGNPSAASASCSMTYVSANCPCSEGVHNITATYNGDMAHPGSSDTFTLNVTPLNRTTTSVTCNPNPTVINQPSSCEVTVTDTSSTPTTPTGSYGNLCTLGSASSSSASCTFTIIGRQSGSITGDMPYSGDSLHYGSQAYFEVFTGRRASSTAMNCTPSHASVNTTITCSATVTDTDVATPITPARTVFFSSNSTGTFSSTICTLAPTGTVGTASCSVSYTPAMAGQHSITGVYQYRDGWGNLVSGDDNHIGSNASSQVYVVSSISPLTIGSVLIVVVRGNDNGLYWNELSSGVWAGWQSLSGATPSPPAICSSGTNMILVVRGMDNGIYLKTFTNGAWSSSWVSPGGATQDQPSCAVLNGTLYIVVRGLDNVTYTNSMSLATLTWSGWVSLNGQTPVAPVLVVTPSANRLDLIVRGLANGIYHKAFVNGAWAATWDTPGGNTPDIPAAETDGRALDIVVRGIDNGLWYNSYDFTSSSWSNWLSVGGATSTAPSVAFDSSGTLHLLVTGLANGIWHISRTAAGVWSQSWDSPGGTTPDRPALIQFGSRVAVLVRGTNNSLFSDILDHSAWSGWTDLGGTSISPPAISPR